MFQPALPLTGYAGWSFLQRTRESQQEAFTESLAVERSTDYFRDNISKIETAEQLVQDRQLLEVALGAFGLDDDIGNKFLIQKVLEEGTLETDTLANRLSDTRYQDLSSSFGFGDFDIPATQISTFADDIIARYEDRQFEQAVGNQNNDLRLAMNFGPGLADLVSDDISDDAKWFSLMGNPPLREVVETALGLPTSFGALDIDKQLETFKERASATFGSEKIDGFSDPEAQEKMIRLFLLRSEVAQTSQISSAQSALTLLSSIQTQNLFG